MISNKFGIKYNFYQIITTLFSAEFGEGSTEEELEEKEVEEVKKTKKMKKKTVKKKHKKEIL